MALPSLEKTWEFDTNQWVYATGSNASDASRKICVHVMNAMLAKKKKAYGGTFADQGSSVVRFTATDQGGNPWVADSELFDPTDVGLDAVFVGSNSAANDGGYAITAVDTASGLWIEFTNASAVFEVDTTVSQHVDTGVFTIPLVVKGSSGSQAGRGAAMDGRDRWLVTSDIRGYDSGDRDWVVFQNSVTGAEILLWLDSQYTSTAYEQVVWSVSPENGFTGGSTSTRPSATDQVDVIPNTYYWPPYSAIVNQKFYWNVMMSSDGESFRMFSIGKGGRIPNFFGMERAQDAVTAGPLIPWNGSQNVMWIVRDQDDYIPLYTILNDAAHVRATIDKDASAGGPYLAVFYMTSEMRSSAMIGQYMNTRLNQLNREAEFYPIGLWTSTTSVKGRHGRLADIWFSNPHNGVSPTGASWPLAGSRQFIKIRDMILPWNGSEIKIR